MSKTPTTPTSTSAQSHSAATDTSLAPLTWDDLDHSPPPGTTLRRVLADVGMSQRDLARRAGLTPKHVNQLMAGTVPLSADVAERLHRVTGVPALLWNRLEADHRTVITRAQQAAQLSTEHAWLHEMPVNELVQRGELPPTPNDAASRTMQLLTYFGVATPAAWRELWLQPNAALRQSTAFEANHAAVATWIRAGQLKAHKEAAKPFDRTALEALLPQLRSASRAESPEKALTLARDLLADVGVTLLFVREFAKSRLNGATTWYAPGAPVIMLSGRGKKFDIIYFTLLHEIGHLLRHGAKETFINDEKPVGRIDPREVEADQFARDTLIPADAANHMSTLAEPDEVVAFAKRHDIHEAIVAGRLCRDFGWRYPRVADLRPSVDIDKLFKP
jgi:HTH-type transcriptional regulator/antitoxin HigA